jgi:hypothetical protein
MIFLVVTETFLQSIASNPMITSVDLRNNHIGPHGLRVLLDAMQYSRTMKKLELSGNYLHDAVR